MFDFPTWLTDILICSHRHADLCGACDIWFLWVPCTVDEWPVVIWPDSLVPDLSTKHQPSPVEMLGSSDVQPWFTFIPWIKICFWCRILNINTSVKDGVAYCQWISQCISIFPLGGEKENHDFVVGITLRSTLGVVKLVEALWESTLWVHCLQFNRYWLGV